MPSAAPARRPRIAYLITNSEIGGAQAHVADLMLAMRQHAEVTLLAGGDGPLLDAARAAGIPCTRLAHMDNALSPVRAARAAHELHQALRACAPDLIHTHSAKASALGRVAGWLAGIPVIYTVHGFAFKRQAPVRQRWAARVAEWMLAPLTNQLICVSEGERQLAAGLPLDAARLTVIRNGLQDVGARATPEAPLRRVVMVARFAAPKRPDVAIEGFAAANLPDASLVIAGDGPRRATVQATVAAQWPGRIDLPGNVRDIPALLASAQTFVLVSDHEAFPLSVLEAMRAGLPVIASDLPGIREQLDDGRCGIVLSDNRPATLARALQALASDPVRRTALGRAARQRWEQLYGLAPMIQSTWMVYQHALSGRRQQRPSASQRHAEY